MSVIEIILFIYILIGFVSSLVMIANTPDYLKSPIDYITYALEKLFKNRNIFGKVLSFIIFIILIPYFVMCLLMMLILLILKFLVWIWDCGYKER